MNKKVRNILKLLISIIAMFIVINSNIIPQCFATNNTSGYVLPKGLATFFKAGIALVQVGVAGWFTIKVTLAGISYFTVTAAQDKADAKNKMKWTIVYAVLAYLGIFLFSAFAL